VVCFGFLISYFLVYLPFTNVWVSTSGPWTASAKPQSEGDKEFIFDLLTPSGYHQRPAHLGAQTSHVSDLIGHLLLG
jgi:hypothetical protein